MIEHFADYKAQLVRLSEEHTIAFKEEMQEAFEHGFKSHYHENVDADDDSNQWQVLPDKDFYQSLKAEGAAIVNISSSRDRMSQPQTESYTAAKGGIAALTHALAVSLAGKVRVNSISPGWIDTAYTVYEGPDAVQQPVGRVGNPLDIANMVLYLCSDKAGFITGENICIDGGMTRQMIYHGDNGWTLTSKQL
jgi:NAD(P)-dependent dehydrogenase (short-subunit alcohol dehydrogenase family)